MEEIWKDIDGYDDYKISNLGRIRSFKPVAYKCVDGILKQSISKGGYCVVGLQKNGNRKGFLVHRLVAIAFISNPENKKTVNHKNGIGSDNHVDNLEWNTSSENILHSFRTLGKKPNKPTLGKKGKLHHNSKPIICINTNQYFESAGMAAEALNLHRPLITKVLTGVYKSTGGYSFKYA
jgi:hypothetical protein